MARWFARFARILPLLVGSGLAVTITGAFGIITGKLSEPLTREQAQCAIAAQIVTDETLNPAVNRPILIKMTNDAALRVDQCVRSGGHD